MSEDRALRPLLTCAWVALCCAPSLGCDGPPGSCSSNDQCGGSELCVESRCRRVCNISADCLADHLCFDGVCWPEASARADAAQADAPGLDAGHPDRAAVDGSAADHAAADQVAIDLVSMDHAPADGAAGDAGGPAACPSVALGGGACQRGCPGDQLHRSTGYDEERRLGTWLCGQQSAVAGTPLRSTSGNAALSVTVRPNLTPTDRRPLVGSRYRVR